MTVTALDANRLVEYSSDLGMDSYVLRYELETVGDHTRFIEIGEANPRGPLRLAIRLFAGGAEQKAGAGGSS